MTKLGSSSSRDVVLRPTFDEDSHGAIFRYPSRSRFSSIWRRCGSMWLRGGYAWRGGRCRIGDVRLHKMGRGSNLENQSTTLPAQLRALNAVMGAKTLLASVWAGSGRPKTYLHQQPPPFTSGANMYNKLALLSHIHITVFSFEFCCEIYYEPELLGSWNYKPDN